MDLIFRMSRLFVAMTMLTGPAFPVYAGSASAPAAPNKGTPVSFGRGQKTDQGAKARTIAAYLNLPLSFEANHGQTDPSVKFFSRAAGYSLYLTASQSVMVLPRAKAGKAKGSAVVRMTLKGANANPSVRGLDILPGRTSYWLGNDRSKWQNGVEQYAKVKFGQVYPGIDMVYYGKQGRVEHDFVVAPGADPGRILIGFEGGKNLRLDPQGNLIIGVEGGELAYQAPTLYQMRGGQRNPVRGRFVLAGKKQVRFQVGDYIRSKELVIDPALAYSSFLGGSVDDKAYAIAVDAAGNAYVTGATASTDFPTAGSFNAPLKGGAVAKNQLDVFVTKVNPAGTAMLWSVYLGGTADDVGRGIAVDGATHNIYVTGDISSAGTTFPHAPGGTYGTGVFTGVDAFVVGIADAGGTSPTMTYGVVFGGGADDSARGIAVDALDNVYVTGQTTSVAGGSFPIYPVGAAQPLAGGGASQAFVSKFSAAGTLVYSTYLGGTGVCHGNAIAVDATGNAYITGQTGNEFFTASDWPNVFKKTITGSLDAFIAKLDPTGAIWLYKTYVGGANIDEGTGIAVDSSSPPNIYITGYTFSADFPGSGFVPVGQMTIGTAPDAFVFKLKTAQTGASDGVYSTYLGGSTDDRATGIVVDGSGNAYVTGTTTSGDLSVVNPISIVAPATGNNQGVLPGSPSAFVAELGPTGATKVFLTYLGGTTQTFGQGIALHPTDGTVYVTGYTNSASATFPLVTGSFQMLNGGGVSDGFVSRLGTPGVPETPPTACTISGISPNTGFSVGGTTVTITGTGFFGVYAPNAVTFDGINASTYTVNASSTVITAVTPRHPLTGTLTAGAVSAQVAAAAGACTATYSYTVAPAVVVGGGIVCGDDFFFPSPATGATGTFAYCMNEIGTATIKIWNVVGDLVAKLESITPAGAQSQQLNTARLAPGVYLYQIEKRYSSGTTDRGHIRKFAVHR